MIQALLINVGTSMTKKRFYRFTPSWPEPSCCSCCWWWATTCCCCWCQLGTVAAVWPTLGRAAVARVWLETSSYRSWRLGSSGPNVI